MYTKTKQIFVASLVALALVGMNCSNSNDGDSGGSGSNGSGGGSSTVAVTGVSLDKTSEVIYVGDSTTLTATIDPSNASNTDVTWKSSDDTVATVDTNGKVTAVSAGTATITVTTDNGGFTASTDITVAVTFKTVVAGYKSSYAVSTDGKLYAWGKNDKGQLGDGTTTDSSTPKEIMAGIKTVVVSGDSDRPYALAISIDGKLYAWGKNDKGQLGDDTTTDSHTPKEIKVAGTTFKTVTVVATSIGSSSYAISTDGKLYAWGSNDYGQLGDGTPTDSSTPKEIKVAGTTFQTVVANGGSSYAISTDDKLYAWGWNEYGQLGDGTTATRYNTPKEIKVAGTTFKTVVAGGGSSYAISTDGKLYTWGNNYYGQLGDDTTTDSSTPKEIKVAGTTFQTVVAGGGSSYAVSTDGKLYAWGYNGYGQLGNGESGYGTNKSTPIKIMTGIKTVVAGQYHTLAISTDDKLYAWGSNYSGQLGDGSTDNRNIPQEIMAGTTFQTVVAGEDHTLAISTDDKLYAWGSNYSGQLGDGTTTNRSTPKEIKVYE